MILQSDSSAIFLDTFKAAKVTFSNWKTKKKNGHGMLGVSPKHYGTAITSAFSVSAVDSLMEENFVECMNYLDIQIGKHELQV